MTIQLRGCGKLGEAILQVILAIGHDKRSVFVTTKTQESMSRLQKKYGMQCGIAANPDVVIILIKPQSFHNEEYPFDLNVPILSYMAGVSLSAIQQKTGGSIIIRAMTSLAVTQHTAVTGYIASNDCMPDVIDFVEKIGCQSGVVQSCEHEEQLDDITIATASGLAYFYYLSYLLQIWLEQQGRSQQQAYLMCTKTLQGSASMIGSSGGKDLQEMISAVVSKGGTTEKVLSTLEAHDFGKTFLHALDEGKKRAKELSM